MFLFYFGFIGDVFDGIIARKLNMDTTMIRRLDSLFDSLFWLAATFLLYKFSTSKDLILYGMGTIIFIILIEYLVCFCRFQKTPSSHNLISKFFGLSLFILYACLFTEIETPTLGIGIIIFGIIARIDSLIIYLILNKWTHDIPSSYHALLINNGKEFKRNKLFHSNES
ncbi:MAG: CDP-alcohol phosphatidyltransferase family protein [Crocinitomicaceae bacterium]|nr:CDP-alcohol phosphatidyltransferase family protein [Crocinitomicaceae bacterium]